MLNVTRTPIRLTPDSRRVVIRFFRPGDDQRIRGHYQPGVAPV